MSRTHEAKRKKRDNPFTRQPPLHRGTAELDNAIMVCVNDLMILRRLLKAYGASEHAEHVSFMIDDLKSAP